MDIKKLSLMELKAMAYDELAQIQTHQGNLKIINDEILLRLSEEKTEKEDKKA